MANTKISALTANTNPNWSEEFVYAYNNANGKITLNTMKAFVWGAWVTTLNADANIWELDEGFYETTYDLYYKTWETVYAYWSTKSQLLFVTKESTGERWFFVVSEWHVGTNYNSAASFWYSVSSSEWASYRLADRAWAFGRLLPVNANTYPGAIGSDIMTQIVSDAQDDNELKLSTSRPPYPWFTYTVYISSVASWETYSVTLWSGVTNPLWITLPTSSTKKCVITVFATSETTAIVTWCTIEP